MGRISDKKLTNSCGYLNTLDNYSEIMVDKCFLLSEECVAREIRLHVPPGKNGKTQMDPADERKTIEIANLQILVEQPIQ